MHLQTTALPILLVLPGLTPNVARGDLEGPSRAGLHLFRGEVVREDARIEHKPPRLPSCTQISNRQHDSTLHDSIGHAF